MPRGGGGRRRRGWGENGFEGWGGYMAAKKAKLEGQFAEDAEKERDEGEEGGIFKGVAIFVNGYTSEKVFRQCSNQFLLLGYLNLVRDSV